MPVVENLRLRELLIVVNQNKSFFDEFVAVLSAGGYASVFDFVNESDADKAAIAIRAHFNHSYQASLLNGIGEPYDMKKARWYLITWLLRDAPAQRLEPLLSSVEGENREARMVNLVNLIRAVSALQSRCGGWG